MGSTIGCIPPLDAYIAHKSYENAINASPQIEGYMQFSSSKSYV